MKGIRWIIGFPLSFAFYKFLLWVNYQFVFFFAPKISFIPEIIWQLEYLFANSVVSVYLGLFFLYMILPRDSFALVNNLKVKFIYWFLSLWTIFQLIITGSLVYEAMHNYEHGMIFRILYAPVMIVIMWLMYKGLEMVDYKHNQPARDYLEELKYQEYLDALDVLEENEKQTAISN